MDISVFLGELVGTLLLILLGNGVVANVILHKTKGNGSGWIVISTGWALAVAIPVFIFGSVTGAHFNPAVTISLAVIGSFPWENVPMYIVAQLIGAFIGSLLVLICYYNHFEKTEDKEVKLAVFCTGPEIRNTKINLITEIIGTFVLVFAILGIGQSPLAEGIQPIVVGMIVGAIGLCLGGPTGYAINPARDLGPRLMHYLMPVPNKGDSDWGYAWIPIVGPIVGAIAGALVYISIF